MGLCGVIMGLCGMLKTLLMISASMTFGCVSMELRSVFMTFGGFGVFFFWHCLTPFGIYPLSKSDGERIRLVVPRVKPEFMPPKRRIAIVDDSIDLDLRAFIRGYLAHTNNSSMPACNFVASLGAQTFTSLSKYTKTSLFAHLTAFLVLA